MAKSGFNKLFKDGTGGLRAGGSNSTKAEKQWVEDLVSGMTQFPLVIGTCLMALVLN